MIMMQSDEGHKSGNANYLKIWNETTHSVWNANIALWHQNQMHCLPVTLPSQPSMTNTDSHNSMRSIWYHMHTSTQRSPLYVKETAQSKSSLHRVCSDILIKKNSKNNISLNNTGANVGIHFIHLTMSNTLVIQKDIQSGIIVVWQLNLINNSPLSTRKIW